MPVGNDTEHDVEWDSEEGDPGGGGNLTVPVGGAVTAFLTSGAGTLAMVVGCFAPGGFPRLAMVGAALLVFSFVLQGVLILRGRRREPDAFQARTSARASASAESLEKAAVLPGPCGPTLKKSTTDPVKLKVGAHVVFCYQGKEIGRSVSIADENAEVRIRRCLSVQQASAGLRAGDDYHVDVL